MKGEFEGYQIKTMELNSYVPRSLAFVDLWTLKTQGFTDFRQM